MSKSEIIYVKGKAKWARTMIPDEWDKWKITVYPGPTDLEKVRDLQARGLKNVLKKDDEGYHVSFSRPQHKSIKGRLVSFTPPEVLMADGRTPLGQMIGNGSDVTVKLEVYPHGTPGGGKAVAARLESIRVDNLVPYIEDEESAARRNPQLEGNPF
jgi:hypothetical protein